jgi:hypothetical protein
MSARISAYSPFPPSHSSPQVNMYVITKREPGRLATAHSAEPFQKRRIRFRKGLDSSTGEISQRQDKRIKRKKTMNIFLFMFCKNAERSGEFKKEEEESRPPPTTINIVLQQTPTHHCQSNHVTNATTYILFFKHPPPPLIYSLDMQRTSRPTMPVSRYHARVYSSTAPASCCAAKSLSRSLAA